MTKIIILILIVATFHNSLAKNEEKHKVSDLKKTSQDNIKQVLKTQMEKQLNSEAEKRKQNLHPQQKHTPNIQAKPNAPKLESKPQKAHDVTKSNSHQPAVKNANVKPPVVQNSQNKTGGLFIEKTSVIFAPVIKDDCPDGSKRVGDQCRMQFRRRREIRPITSENSIESSDEEIHAVPQCIIGCSIPSRCPPGQKEDVNGDCREDWDG